jgi:uncharacterized delta-60 repeat protein
MGLLPGAVPARVLLVAGYAAGRVALVRYRLNGRLDQTFSGDGKTTTDLTAGKDEAQELVIQPDGKIVVAGTAGLQEDDSTFFIARYNVAGRLDNRFGRDGITITDFAHGADAAFAIAIQSDGRLVVAGETGPAGDTTFALARYEPIGMPDTTFSRDGKQTTNFDPGGGSARGITLQHDGKIVIAGGVGFNGAFHAFGLARYNPGGGLDATFGGNGKVRTSFGDWTGGPPRDRRLAYAAAVSIQIDGKILAAGGVGFARGDFALARYRWR